MPIDAVARGVKQKMNEVLEVLGRECRGLHTGRASTSLLEGVKLMSYGQEMPLKSVATLTVPESNQVAITPWDKDQLVAIEAAIRDANLGVSPINDGHAIRVSFPPLTEERRKELVKQLNAMAEEARIALRNVRHGALDQLKKDLDSGDATEDDKFSLTKELDTTISEYNKKIEELVKTKETELLTV